MTNFYQNDKEKYQAFLKDWMDKMIYSRKWEEYVDLHIDEVDGIFKNRSTWLDGSLFIFETLLEIIDKSEYDVFLMMPLLADSKPLEIEFSTFKEVENLLNVSPPSFYLFPRNEKNFDESLKTANYLTKLSSLLNHRVYLKERTDDEYFYRTLYIRSKEVTYLRYN